MPANPHYLTASDVARLAQVTYTVVSRAIASGELVCENRDALLAGQRQYAKVPLEAGYAWVNQSRRTRGLNPVPPPWSVLVEPAPATAPSLPLDPDDRLLECLSQLQNQLQDQHRELLARLDKLIVSLEARVKVA